MTLFTEKQGPRGFFPIFFKPIVKPWFFSKPKLVVLWGLYVFDRNVVHTAPPLLLQVGDTISGDVPDSRDKWSDLLVYLGWRTALSAFHSPLLVNYFNQQLLVSFTSGPLLSHAGVTSSNNNNNSNALTGKWQLCSDHSSGLNWFTACNGFYSQGPGVTNTTHVLRLHL